VALDPIKVMITNNVEEVRTSGTMMFEVQNSPIDTSLGIHMVEMMDVNILMLRIYVWSMNRRIMDWYLTRPWDLNITVETYYVTK